jgi:hypothetical protein
MQMILLDTSTAADIVHEASLNWELIREIIQRYNERFVSMTSVVKNLSTRKYYKVDWRAELPTSLGIGMFYTDPVEFIEVHPVEKTIIVYEVIENAGS